jgi:predicted nucleic acid-binding protein
VRASGPELIAALWRKVRTGQLLAAQATQGARQFRSEWRYRYRIMGLTAAVADEAMRLAEQHVVRGYDAVHVAAALRVAQLVAKTPDPVMIFLSADTQQLAVAMREGLQVDNPNLHP